MKLKEHTPLAITMWDFSWIERRWPGAGFESIEVVLDELCDRGYDAVRIDAFPHLFAEDPCKEWLLLPIWSSNAWGSPYKNKIKLQPALYEFIQECQKRGLKVALSSWYREDADNIRMKITSPEKMAENWILLLEWLEKEGLLETVLYVDLCNEWPGEFWAPYFKNNPPWKTWSGWYTDASMQFMRKAVERLRVSFPKIPFCFSFDGCDVSHYYDRDLSFFDLAEHHIWMAKLNEEEFYREIGKASDPRFTENAYHVLSDRAYASYNSRREYWNNLLVKGIEQLAEAAAGAGLPLATTECWGIVDYKDYPLLRWDWIKELCELGISTASDSGKWAVMATSNFAAPQFSGMWRDVGWHRRMTDMIHKSDLPETLMGSRLANTMWY